MKDLKKFLSQFESEDGTVDYKSAEKALNENINDIVAKNKPSEDSLMEKAVEKVIGELGIEAKDIDGVKTYIKKMGGSTDEIKEQNLKLEKEVEELRTKYEESEKMKSELETNYTTEQQMNKLRAMGFDDDNAEFIRYKVSKMTDDETDFDAALEKYREEKPDVFKDKSISTNKRMRFEDNNDDSGDSIDVMSFLEQKNKK